jgi:selenocysteine lyase/cysteine desulfurase
VHLCHNVYGCTVAHICIGEGGSAFVSRFNYEGTLDYSAYFTFSSALSFRAQFGESAIMTYMHQLAITGGNILANIWHTDWLIPPAATAAMVNVRIPTDGSSVDPASIPKTLLDKYVLYPRLPY